MAQVKLVSIISREVSVKGGGRRTGCHVTTLGYEWRAWQTMTQQDDNRLIHVSEESGTTKRQEGLGRVDLRVMPLTSVKGLILST